ncbi:hypothetical protein IMZ48_10215 [Candidatus Bathyarchaeota archaeon]|nr:hypothetical protein [Candidatus Bathyarchaeota archaeon]
MAQVEFTAPVNHCKWKTGRNKKGSTYRYKAADCHSVSCRYSKDKGKSRCDCL